MIQNLFWIVKVFYQGVVLELVLKHFVSFLHFITFCYIFTLYYILLDLVKNSLLHFVTFHYILVSSLVLLITCDRVNIFL
jgi:hypothetical protein